MANVWEVAEGLEIVAIGEREADGRKGAKDAEAFILGRG